MTSLSWSEALKSLPACLPHSLPPSLPYPGHYLLTSIKFSAVLPLQLHNAFSISMFLHPQHSVLSFMKRVLLF